MGYLIKLSTSKREIRILQESSVKFRDIGPLLVRDDPGARVSAIAKAACGDELEAVRKIYETWMQEDEDHSWKKLIKCFRDVQLNSLAKDLELHFGLPSPSDRGKVADTLQTIVHDNQLLAHWKGHARKCIQKLPVKKGRLLWFCLGARGSRFSGWLFLSSISRIHVLRLAYLSLLTYRGTTGRKSRDSRPTITF